MVGQSSTGSSGSSAARDFLSFVRSSPSPFHAVAESRRRLERAGFVAISEKDEWNVKRNGRYFFTRNQSSLVAFVVGGLYNPGNGFSIVGAHTDSPCLKVKPISKKETAGYIKVGVECYGGGLWNTWFDRDLGIAGRVMVKAADGSSIQHKLVQIDEPILRIPTLAIHLDRGVSEGFKFNNETHLTPMLGLAAKALNGAEEDKTAKHHSLLLAKIANQLNIKIEEIGDFELCLFDTHPSTIGGINEEFIFSARLDNLMSSFCAVEAIIKSVAEGTEGSQSDPQIRVVSLFDNEEVGSTTAFGADSDLLEVTLRRLAGAAIEGQQPLSRTSFEQALTKSYLVSADMAHAIHPNYSEKHEENHRPQMNKGIVVKLNANQRYATNSVTTTIMREVAKKRNVPLQEFVVRNDSPCGSTIGPMLSAKLGLRTIDVGNPQLSMHSIRETCGVHDVGSAIDLFQSFFEDFAAIDQRVHVDL